MLSEPRDHDPLHDMLCRAAHNPENRVRAEPWPRSARQWLRTEEAQRLDSIHRTRERPALAVDHLPLEQQRTLEELKVAFYAIVCMETEDFPSTAREAKTYELARRQIAHIVRHEALRAGLPKPQVRRFVTQLQHEERPGLGGGADHDDRGDAPLIMFLSQLETVSEDLDRLAETALLFQQLMELAKLAQPDDDQIGFLWTARDIIGRQMVRSIESMRSNHELSFGELQELLQQITMTWDEYLEFRGQLH